MTVADGFDAWAGANGLPATRFEDGDEVLVQDAERDYLGNLAHVQELLRAAEGEAQGLRGLRDALMRNAFEAGASQAEIARIVGLSRAQVQRICDYSRKG